MYKQQIYKKMLDKKICKKLKFEPKEVLNLVQKGEPNQAQKSWDK